MAKAQKRISVKSRSEEIDRVLSAPEPEEAPSEPNRVQFKIELPKHYRTCHLFDGSIATAIYVCPAGFTVAMVKAPSPTKPTYQGNYTSSRCINPQGYRS